MGGGASINEFESLSSEQLANKIADLGEEFISYKGGVIAKGLDGKTVAILSREEQLQALKDAGVVNESHLDILLKEFENIKSKSLGASGPSPIVFAGYVY